MNIDKVYVSWNEHWDVNRYVDEYLRNRRHLPGHDARDQVLRYIEHYPGDPPFTKSNLDYFLDANFARKE
jgi:hypothetical protein